MRRLAATAVLIVTTLVLGSCAKKTPTLNLLVWEGYADPLFVKGFEEKCQCKISASYMGSSDELVAKLRGGSASNYDVISPSSDVATSIVKSGLAAPLDLSKIPSYSQTAPQLRAMPLVKDQGKVYGVPFMWEPNPRQFNTSVFLAAPPSGKVLWNRNLLGKFSAWTVF